MGNSQGTVFNLLGYPSLPGSLCNMREIISHKLVDKNVKVFSTADEFIFCVFQAHFQATICSILGIASTSSRVVYPCTQTWLDETAEAIVAKVLMPQSSNAFFSSFYLDLWNAVRWENGSQIIRH